MSIVLPHFGPLDLTSSLRTLRVGTDDPTWAFTADGVWHAMATPEGPATLQLVEQNDEVLARAWGAGGDWLLAHVPACIGMHDVLDGFDASVHPAVARLVREHPGFRIPQSLSLFDALVWAVAAQRSSAFEGQRAFRQLIEAHGADAPGPRPLRILPTPQVIAGIPNYELHTYGFEQERADLLRRIGAMAGSFAEEFAHGVDASRSMLRGVDGLDEGSVELALLRAFGAPDAVPTGDPRRTSSVGALLANDPNISDEQMHALLDAFPGHRGRVILLAESAATTWQHLPPAKVTAAE